MLKKLIFTITALGVVLTSSAQYMSLVYKPSIPVRVDRDVNIVMDINVPNTKQGSVLNYVEVELATGTLPSHIQNISAYYTGTASMLQSRSANMALSQHAGDLGGGQRIYVHPSYAILKNTTSQVTKTNKITMNQRLVLGGNYFYLSVKLAPDFPLTSVFDLKVTQVVVDGKPVTVKYDGPTQPFRTAVAVRDAGDDSVHSYRIPALVTTPGGTLIAAYDVRRFSNMDLQEDVQVGFSRSTDGGRTWGTMGLLMDMRGINGLPDGQNGVGDPALLVDPTNGDVYAMALWTHGISGNRAWWGVSQGMDYRKGAAQVLVSRSTDDGQTWSKPDNITKYVRDSTWFINLQGPGRGITMRDGTLVFPYQFVDSARMPHATIVYSRDKGATWTVGTAARSNTTEAQVVELTDGELMLNMRDNRGGSRAVMITRDMGKTWTEHSSSRAALQEPVCMASLIDVAAQDNTLGRNILLFSNPNTIKGRRNITVKASLDSGTTWLLENQLLLDEEFGWGYSCLTMVNTTTVGILYESSVGQLLFQAVPLVDIIKK